VDGVRETAVRVCAAISSFQLDPTYARPRDGWRRLHPTITSSFQLDLTDTHAYDIHAADKMVRDSGRLTRFFLFLPLAVIRRIIARQDSTDASADSSTTEVSAQTQPANGNKIILRVVILPPDTASNGINCEYYASVHRGRADF
jgi:hypothetical protein